MVTDAHRKLLADLETGASPHTGRTLREHLEGTRALLEAWGNPPDVCIAGLFHSIYGTQSYKERSAELTERERVRAAIGERAEELAYLFCVTDRSSFFEQVASPRAVLRDRLHEKELAVSRETLRDLIEIEVANYVEFAPRSPLTRDELEAFARNVELARSFLSPAAHRAALELVARAARPRA